MAKKGKGGNTPPPPPADDGPQITPKSNPEEAAPPPAFHPGDMDNSAPPPPVDGIPVASPKTEAPEAPSAPRIDVADVSRMAQEVAAKALQQVGKSAPTKNEDGVNYDSAFEQAVKAEVERRLADMASSGAVSHGLDMTPTKDSEGKTLWLYVNRNPFPIFLPDPNDPGSRVAFPPCPDKAKPLGMMDFRTHPFFASFVGFKRSVSQEPVPVYLKMREEDMEARESDGTAHDLMKMDPDTLSAYIKNLAQHNPDVAAQVTNALAPSRRVSQAPPGM